MATYVEHGQGVGRPLIFQRARRFAAARRSRKRRALRTTHVLGLTALVAGLFFGLGRAYLFVISWDQLTIRTIELRCERPVLRQALEEFLQTRPLGNILLCDISALQGRLKSFAWVKDARVQKVFPSTLKLEIVERTPFALLERGGLAVVDRESVVLEPVASAEDWRLPVVRDEGGFGTGFETKWEAARACLEALTGPEKAGLATLECSDDGRVTLAFREDSLRLILDGAAVREKLDRFAVCRADLESRFGALDYADLRFDDRIIVRPLEPAAQNPPPKSEKEAK